MYGHHLFPLESGDLQKNLNKACKTEVSNEWFGTTNKRSKRYSEL